MNIDEYDVTQVGDVMGEISKRLSSLKTIESLRKSGISSTTQLKSSIVNIDDIVRPGELLEKMIISPHRRVDIEEIKNKEVRLKYPNLINANVRIIDKDDIKNIHTVVRLSKKLKVLTIYSASAYFTTPGIIRFIRLFPGLRKLTMIFDNDDSSIIELEIHPRIQGSVILEVYSIGEIFNADDELYTELRDMNVSVARTRYNEGNDDSIIYFIQNLNIVELIVGTNDEYVNNFDYETYQLMSDIMLQYPNIKTLTANDGDLFESFLTVNDLDNVYDSITLLRSNKNKLNFFYPTRGYLEGLFPSAIIEVLIPTDLDIEFYFKEDYGSPESINRYSFIRNDDVYKFILDYYNLNMNLRHLIIQLKDGTQLLAYPKLTKLQTGLILNMEECELFTRVIQGQSGLQKIKIEARIDDDIDLQELIDRVSCLMEGASSINKVHLNVDEDSVIVGIDTVQRFDENIKSRMLFSFPGILLNADESGIRIPHGFLKNVDGVMIHHKGEDEDINDYLNKMYIFVKMYNTNVVYVKSWISERIEAILSRKSVREVIINLDYNNYVIPINTKFYNVEKLLLIGDILSVNNFRLSFPNAEIKQIDTSGFVISDRITIFDEE